MTAALSKSTRLRTLSSLLASMFGAAPGIRGDVDAVLRVLETDEVIDLRLGTPQLAKAASQVMQLLAPDCSNPAVAVLDYRTDPFDALWANERVEAAFSSIGEFSDVLIWVVGLQEHYTARNRSMRCRAAYEEAVGILQSLVARKAGRRRVTLIVL